MKNKPFIAYREDLKTKAKDNRKAPTEAEKLLWHVIRNKKLKGYKFHRQKPLGNYIIDFYCSELKLAIEIDGDSHTLQEVYDNKRTAELKKNGITVKRYWNNDILENIDGVYEDLLNAIEQIKNDL